MNVALSCKFECQTCRRLAGSMVLNIGWEVLNQSDCRAYLLFCNSGPVL